MMVLDSFVLELGLDPSKFTTGQREAMDSLRKMEEVSLGSGRAIEAQGKKTLDLLSSFRREAIATLGLVFGGREAKEFLNWITSVDASAGRLGKTLGMTGTEVSTWGGAIRSIGGSTESATAALGGLSGEMSRFQLTGQSSILPVLSRLGVSLYDQNRNLKTAGQLWLDLAGAVEGMDPRQATAFLQMIPGANQDMINFALLGRRAMEDYLKVSRQSAPTPEQIAAAQEYQRSLSRIDTSATNLGRTMVNWLAPALTTVMDKMNQLVTMWNATPGSAKGNEIVTGARAATASRLGRPRALMEWMRDNLSVGDEDRAKWDRIINNLYANDSPGRAHFAARLHAQNTGAGNLPANWDNFLSGLSFLETSQQNAPGGPGHSASGYFQFQPPTAGRATGAGLADPRVGSYGDQAGATMQYIKRFHPEAAAAIDRGEFGPAIASLRGEWPSLPGGSQPQSAARYGVFAQELRGGGPRAGSTINVGGVNVYTSAGDGAGIARDVDRSLQRSLSAGAANTGAQ